MKQNKYGTWAVGAFMLLLSAAACTDSYERCRYCSYWYW